jgi:hypothetical protein
VTDDKVREVVRMYQGRLAALGVEPRRLADVTYRTAAHLLVEHCSHVCVEILGFIDAGRREKAFRWLGWLQCALWVAGIIPTINDGARDSMPAGEEFRP